MAEKKLFWIMSAILAVICVVYSITTIIALNCLADKKNDCAQTSGIMAAVCGCLAASAIGVLFFANKND